VVTGTYINAAAGTQIKRNTVIPIQLASWP
jgi:hypothetical protein